MTEHFLINNKPIKVCLNCGTVFTYTQDDIVICRATSITPSSTIRCPTCNHVYEAPVEARFENGQVN